MYQEARLNSKQGDKVRVCEVRTSRRSRPMQTYFLNGLFRARDGPPCSSGRASPAQLPVVAAGERHPVSRSGPNSPPADMSVDGRQQVCYMPGSSVSP